MAEPTVSAGELQAISQAEENAATENDRIKLPNPACALVGAFGWWLSRGSMGSASSQCGSSGVWCRHVVRRWRDHAASRLQRWRRRRSGAIYCESCWMLLNGPSQFQDHVLGKKHKKNRRALRRAQRAVD